MIALWCLAVAAALALAVTAIAKADRATISLGPTPPSAVEPPTSLDLRTGPVLSRREAAALAARAWEIRRYAYLARDDDFARAAAAGRALDIDLVRCRHGCPDPAIYEPGAWYVSLVDRDRGTHVILAQARGVTPSGDDDTLFIVLERATLAAPWRIVVAGHQERSDNAVFANDSVGADAERVRPQVAVDSLFPELARWWQTWHDDGHAPENSPLAPDDELDYLLTHGREVYANTKETLSAGVDNRTTYAPGETWEFPGAWGATVTCGYLEWHSVAQPLTGDDFQVPWSIDQVNNFLPFGRYRQVESSGARATCIVVHGAEVKVIGDGGYLYDVDGEPSG